MSHLHGKSLMKLDPFSSLRRVANVTVVACLLIIGSLQVGVVRAANSGWSFEPEPFEWQAWPDYCRIQWTKFSNGRNPNGQVTYSNTDHANLQQAIGRNSYDGLHHWCAGMIYLSRSKVATKKETRLFLLNQAAEDSEFTFQRAEPGGILYPKMAITVAQIRLALGNQQGAFDVLNEVITAQPTRIEPYVVLAGIYLSQKNREEAAKVVREARNKAGSVTSPEIHYNLGLLSLSVGDIPAAVASAKIAYSGGYPLLGLKKKLIQLGKWKDEYAVANQKN